MNNRLSKDEKLFLVDTYKSVLKKNGYNNYKKLELLFEFWLELLNGFLKFNLILPTNELNLIEKVYHLKPKKSKKNNLKKNNFVCRIILFLKKILSIIPMHKAIISGGVQNKFDWIIILLTSLKLKYLKIEIDKDLKQLFLVLVKEQVPQKKYDIIKEVLADNFFIKPIEYLLPLKIYGSPIALLNDVHIPLLFFNKKITLISFQHGGQYGEYKDDEYNKFEIKISDKFFHWGLGKRNIHQNRFKIKRQKFERIKKIVLLETLQLSEFQFNLIKGSKEIYMDAKKNRVKNLKDIVNHGLFLQKHPKSNQNSYNKIKLKGLHINSDTNGNENLFIIDVTGHTFLFKAIYEDIPFLLFFNRDWVKWFTPNYIEFLSFLNDNKFLFYWDQKNKFNSYIKNYFLTEKMEFKNNFLIRNYLKTKIKS